VEKEPEAPTQNEGGEEHDRPAYTPINAIVWSLQLARATVAVLTKQYGPEFARAVQRELVDQAKRYETGNEYERADAPFVQELAESPMWDRLAGNSEER